LSRRRFLVIPSEAEGPAVQRTLTGNAEFYLQTKIVISTGAISCHAALETTACAAFSTESRMKFANATGNPG
jgi:hypothetical protein